MSKTEINICPSGIIQPLERDPIPLNKIVFEKSQTKFPDRFNYFQTLGVAIEVIKDMGPVTNEPPEITRSKMGFAEIFAERKLRRMAEDSAIQINQETSETP